MQEYGVTEKGFVLKRMDKIMDEVHSDLSAGFGVDTRASQPSMIDVIVTTFCGQIADLWEVAQENYYSKIPSMATRLNLDNAVQFGGIKREGDKRSKYRLHCTGEDGTIVRENTVVGTDTLPQIRLYSEYDFIITREKFNAAEVVVSSLGGIYTVGINGKQYSFSGSGTEETILNGLKSAIQDSAYQVTVEKNVLKIEDKTISRNGLLTLSDNLTTKSVTTIADFLVQDFGRISVAKGTVRKIINNISGFNAVNNKLEAVYFGRLKESDVELRQSYIAKSALRSNTMVDSIVAELLNNVPGVESASGHENSGDTVNERGMPPHSIEIIVQGGENQAIAEAILRRRAGGIPTHGSVVVPITTENGDIIPIKFNRPEKLYVWLKVKLKGDTSLIPTNFAELVKDSIMNDTEQLPAGKSLQTQLLFDGIYQSVSAVEHIKILVATSTSSDHVPISTEYSEKNINVLHRQSADISKSRIEVLLNASD